MEKDDILKLATMIFLYLSLTTLGFYIYFIIYKPIIDVYLSTEGKLGFSIFNIINVLLWEISLFCFISTSMKLKIFNKYDDEFEIDYQPKLYYILIGFGLLFGIGAVIFSPSQVGTRIQTFDRTIYLLNWLVLFTGFLPLFIGFISHYKSLASILKNRDKLLELTNDYKKNKDLDEGKSKEIIQDMTKLFKSRESNDE